MLTQSQHVLADAVRQAADDGRRLAEAWTTAGDVQAVKDRLVPYLDAVAQTLAELRAASKGRRGAFWKAT
jgi:hypothetical protein